jgi:predicted RNA binding protein YcfA (HicA-like mRNA interferase family)
MEDSLNKRKLLAKAERSPNNLSFAEFISLIEAFGFRLKRQRGSHHIFSRRDVAQIMDVQPEDGKAKRYQVEQLLDLVERYGLSLED